MSCTLGSSIVVHHLHPRVSADLKYFSTLHCAGVDEDDLPCRGFTEAEASVDKPCCRRSPSRPLSGLPQSLLQGRFALCLALLVPLLFHLVESPGRYLRFRFGAPFSPNHNSDQFSDMHQLILHVPHF